LTKEGVWGIVTFRDAAKQSYPIKAVTVIRLAPHNLGSIIDIEGKEMNVRKGTLRLAIVLSVLSVMFGVMIGTAGGDEDFAFTIGIFGLILVWICYLGFWFVLKGFDAHKCENCEKNLGKLEKIFKFKEHMVCAECHKKLNENKEEKFP